MKVRLVVIVGTRPEVIKLAPVIRALRAGSWADVHVLATGQHEAVIRPLLRHFELAPYTVLPIERKTGSLCELISLVAGAAEGEINPANVDGLIVQGDTTSAMIAAVCGYSDRVPVFHVEAGLRTSDLSQPFPEEFNRRIISVAAELHFAPTDGARSNLLREGVDPSRCHVVGNSGIDALMWTLEKTRRAHSVFPAGSFGILVTGHRRESWGPGLTQVCEAVREIVCRIDRAHVLFPVHPNPAVRTLVEGCLGRVARLTLREPMDYVQFCEAMADARLIITDSGGIQEEALALGKPTLVTRDRTERPEVLERQTVQLVGLDKATIVNAALKLYGDAEAYSRASVASFPFGRGDAAAKIACLLEERFAVCQP